MPIQNLSPPSNLSSSSPQGATAAAPSAGGDWQAQLDDFISIYLGTKPLLHQNESFGQVALDALPEVDPNDAEMQRRPFVPDARAKASRGSGMTKAPERTAATAPLSTTKPHDSSPLQPKAVRVEDKASANVMGNADTSRPSVRDGTLSGGRVDVYV